MNIILQKVFVALIILLIGISTSFAVVDLNNGLVAHYAFNGNANDTSGNGIHAAIVGSVSYVNTDTDKGIYINNSPGSYWATQWVALPNHDSITSLSNKSFTIIIKYKTTDSLQQNGRLCGSWYNNGGLAIDYNAMAQANAYALIRDNVRTNIIADGSSFSNNLMARVTDGNWHYQTIILDRNSNLFVEYIDGILIDSMTVTGLGSVGFNNFVIGATRAYENSTPDLYSARFTTVDDFKMYNRALNADEILAIVDKKPPKFISPQNQSLSVSRMNVNLKWAPVLNAQKYRVQFGVDSAMLSKMRDSLMDSTKLSLGNLNIYTSYYWRVKAYRNSDSTKWSDVWKFTTEQLFGPTLITPLNQAVGQPTSINFKWNSLSGATSYHLMVNNGGTIAYNDSTLTDTITSVSGLANSITYTWKVAAVIGGNKSTFVSRTFKTVPGSLGTVYLNSPQFYYSNQPRRVDYSWYSVADAQNYRIQFSNKNSFDSLLLDSLLLSNASSFHITFPEYGTKYYTRIRAEGYELQGNWSAICSVTTKKREIVFENPRNDSAEVAGPIYDIRWSHNLDTVKTYRLILANDTLQSVHVLDTNFYNAIPSGRLNPLPLRLRSLIDGVNYYVKIYASTPDQDTVVNTGWRYFKTRFAQPGVPANGTLVTTDSVQLLWSYLPGHEGWCLQYDTDPLFKKFDSVFTEYYINGDSTFKIGVDQNYTTYYWRYQAGIGDTSYSPVWNFKTGLIFPPTKPVIINPALSNYKATQTSIDLTWKNDTTANSSRVQLAKNANFDSLIIDSIFVPSIKSDSATYLSLLAIKDLKYNTEYYIRVSAANVKGNSSWSSICTLSVPYDLPGEPELQSPTWMDTIKVDSVKLVWKASNNTVTRYRISISDSVGDHWDLINPKYFYTSDTSYVLKNLAKHKTYYWFVQGENGAGLGNSGTEYWIFYTDIRQVVNIPSQYALKFSAQNGKNGLLNYALPKQSDVTIRIYNVTGKILVDYFKKSEMAGYYQFDLDPNGNKLRNGQYILEFIADEYVAKQKIVILR